MNKANFLSSDAAIELMANKGFDSLNSEARKARVISTDIVVFYARNGKKLFRQNAFWQSKFPLLFINEVLESAQGGNFLRSYLRSDTNCNHELNKAILRVQKEKLLFWFKVLGNYRNTVSELFNSLRLLDEADVELEEFLNECLLYAKKYKNATNRKDQLLKNLYGFEIDKLLVALHVLHFDYKQDERALNNRAWLVMMEVNLGRLYNNFIHLMKSGLVEPNLKLPIASLFEKFRAPRKSINEKKPSKRPIWLNEVIKVLLGLIDVLSIEFEISHFEGSRFFKPQKSKKHHTDYRYDDIKSSLEEQYFIHPNHTFSGITNVAQNRLNKDQGELVRLIKNQDFKGIERYEIDEVKRSVARKFEFYGVPKFIGYKNIEINLLDLIRHLIDFSRFKGPCRNQIFKDKNEKILEIVLNEPSEHFEKCFGNNQIIDIYDRKEFEEQFSNYFKIEKEVCERFIDYLTLKDFNLSNNKDWFQYPFIQFDDRIIWSGAFLRDRNWFNILMSRLKSENGVFRAQYAKRIEEKVSDLFSSQGFKIISGRKYKLIDGQNGEVDLIAIKGNSIFIVEVKTVLSKEDPASVSRIEQEKLNEEAIIQLAKDRVFIDENWFSVSEELGLEYALDEMTVSQLIVTDFFEGDQMMLPREVIKASLLELDIIFKNSMKRLYENYWANHVTQNALNREFNNEYNPLMENLDLWSNEEPLTPALLAEIIRKKKVWSPLYEIWKF